MPVYYLSTDANKVAEVVVDDTTGSLVKMTMYPTADNPDSLPPKSPGGISTQWIVQHPHLPSLWVTLTSFWNQRPAMLSCFDSSSSGDKTNTNLTKMAAEGSTGGREAVHAVFAPTSAKEENATLAISHHNDGFVCFFQFPTKEPPTSFMDQPAITLELPVMDEKRINVLPNNNKNRGLSVPSSHQVFYAPNSAKWLMVVDSSQSVIFTYECDPKTGLPVPSSSSTSVDDNKNEEGSSDNNIYSPAFTFTCHTDAPALGWFSGIVTTIKGLGCRPRRVAMSANGEYIYVSYETRNVIQIYHVDQETGQIDPEKKGYLQEVSTLEPELTKQPLIGLTLQASAEMMVVGDSLFVSNRGGVVVAGKGENSVCVYDIRDGGRLCSSSARVVPCSGPVRHFCVYSQGEYEYLVAGTSNNAEGSLETFRRKIQTANGEAGGAFEAVGQAEVGVNVLCVLPAITAASSGSGLMKRMPR